MAARTHWLHEREFGSELLFPSHGRDRYAGETWPLLPEDQLDDLPKRLHWLVDTSEPLKLSPNAEWDAILELVGGVTALEQGALSRFRDHLVRRGYVKVDGMRRVEEFTQPATAEAIADGCTVCPICMETFSDGSADELESAVMTVCGHFLGRKCLQQWADAAAESGSEDDTTCPTCRTALIIGQFPIQVQRSSVSM